MRVFSYRTPMTYHPAAALAKVEAVSAYGFEPVFMVTNGDLNSWRVALDENSEPVPHDWSRAGNFVDPPVESAVRGVARRNRKAGNFPVVFDIERTKALNFWDEEKQQALPLTLEARRAALGYMADMARWARDEMGPGPEIYWYYFPLPNRAWGEDTADEQRALAQVMSGACNEFYNTVPAGNPPAEWRGWVERDRAAADELGLQRRLAVVTPYRNSHANDAAPLDLAVWKDQLDYLDGTGWDAFVWLSTGPEGYEPHLEYARSLMAETNTANLGNLNDDQLFESLDAHVAEVNRREIEAKDRVAKLIEAQKKAIGEIEK